jgi:hypothetical protein
MTPAKAKPLALKDEGAQTPAVAQAQTPLQMFSQALERGASTEILEKLMALAERWQGNQARQEFEDAIAAAKSEIKPIRKNKKVGYDTRGGGGKVGYSHETLDEIAKEVDPILAKHGLRYRWRTDQNGNEIVVVCVLSHKGGHFEETTLKGPADTSGSKNPMQAIGSAVTYLERYTLRAALGLSSSEQDDDGKASGNPGTISAKQFNELDDLLTKTDAKRDAFNQMYKIEDLADLPVNKFEDARAKLLRKLKAKEEGHDPRTSD